MDSIVVKYQNVITGTQIDAGRSVGTSLTVSDKGATANIGLGKIGNSYLQATVRGQGKDKFVSFVKDGKYQNTVSGGVRWHIFAPSSANFYEENAKILNNRLYLIRNEKGEWNGYSPTTAYNDKLKFVYDRIADIVGGHHTYKQARSKRVESIESKNLERFLSSVDTLVKLKFLPEDFLSKNDSIQGVEINKLSGKWESPTSGSGPEETRLKYYLGETENLQLQAKWSSISFHWFTLGADINLAPYQIFDAGNKAKDYIMVHNDYFGSFSASYSFLRVFQGSKQYRFLSTPTISLSYARVFKDEDKYTIERLKSIALEDDQYVYAKNLVKEVYPGIADKKFVASFELPIIWYSTDMHWGLEVTPKLGINDPKNDNIGIKFGVFIPMEVKDGVPVTIQPIFRFQKLMSSGKHVFWEDNFSMGFSLSVSLPKAFGKIK